MLLQRYASQEGIANKQKFIIKEGNEKGKCFNKMGDALITGEKL